MVIAFSKPDVGHRTGTKLVPVDFDIIVQAVAEDVTLEIGDLFRPGAA